MSSVTRNQRVVLIILPSQVMEILELRSYRDSPEDTSCFSHFHTGLDLFQDLLDQYHGNQQYMISDMCCCRYSSWKTTENT